MKRMNKKQIFGIYIFFLALAILILPSVSALNITLYWNGSEYSPTSRYTSDGYDTNTNPDYDIMTWDASIPEDTTLKLQLRSAATSASLQSATWYGPTSTEDYYDTTPSGEEINSIHDGDRWIQWMAYLATDDTSITPTLYSATINHGDTVADNAPTLTDIPDITFVEGSFDDSTNLSDYVTDVDNSDEDISWTTEGNVNILVDIKENKIANFTANPGFIGSEIITFTATDPGDLSDSTETTITVVSQTTNTPPIIENCLDATIEEDSPGSNINIDLWQCTIDNEDQDSELTFTIVSQSNTNLINCFISNNQYLTCNNPTTNAYGASDIRIRVTDTGSYSDDDTLIITINSVNDAPIITGLHDLSLTEDIIHVMDLTNKISDVDNTLDYLIIYENSSYATVNNKIITFNYPTPITEDVKIIVGDNELNTSQTIKVSVTAVNDAPEFINPQTAFTLLQGETLNYQFIATDEENDPITFSDNTTLFNINANTGIVSFTPSATLKGTFSIRITASDDKGANTSIIISLTVTDKNFPPTITEFTPEDLTPKLEAGYEYEFAYTATDADGTIPSSKWYFDNSLESTNTTFSYSPSELDIGEHTLTLIISDGLLNDSITWKITVIPENHAPVLKSVIPNQEWQQNSKKENAFNLDDYFYDEDKDWLVYSVKGNKNISVKINLVNHTVSFTPDDNWYGAEYVIFVANDGNLVAYSNNITLNVTPVSAICGNNIREVGEGCDGTDNSSCGIYSCKADCTCNRPCTPSWNCSDWSKCSMNNQQTRTCKDLNNCGIVEGKPAEKQSCTYKPTCSDEAQNQFEEGIDCGGPCSPCTKGLSPKRRFNWLWFLIPFILVGLIAAGLVTEVHHKARKETAMKKKKLMEAYQHKTLEEQKERELQHYIEIMIPRGFSENSIKKKLQQEGWPLATLNNVFNRIELHKKVEEKQALMNKLIKKREEEKIMERGKIFKAFEK